MDNLQIKEGLTDKQISQLIEFTKSDPDILRFTQDKTRFKSQTAYQNWLKKIKPIVYGLSDDKGNLAGISWITQKKLPKVEFTTDFDPSEYSFTNGIRIYEKYQGRGIGTWFYKKVLSHRQIKFWNQISTENIASIKLHQKLGFIQVSKPDKKGKVFMTRDNVLK